MQQKFKSNGKTYIVEGEYPFFHIILEDTREILEITGWKESCPPIMDGLKKVPNIDYQECLAKELAEIYEAPIAQIANPNENKAPAKEGQEHE